MLGVLSIDPRDVYNMFVHVHSHLIIEIEFKNHNI